MACIYSMSKLKMFNLFRASQQRWIFDVNKTFRVSLSVLPLRRTHNSELNMISASQQSERRNVIEMSHIRQLKQMYTVWRGLDLIAVHIHNKNQQDR